MKNRSEPGIGLSVAPCLDRRDDLQTLNKINGNITRRRTSGSKWDRKCIWYNFKLIVGCCLTFVGPEKLWVIHGDKLNIIPISCQYFIHKQPISNPSPFIFHIVPTSSPLTANYLPTCPYYHSKLPTPMWGACWDDVVKSCLCPNSKWRNTSRVGK